MNRIVWSVEAQHQLRAITVYYGEIAPDLPALMIARIERAASKLIDFPCLGATLPDSDIRLWSVKATPYLLFYRVVGGDVRILKVVDARSDWKPRT